MTWAPDSAASRAAVRPRMPPPMTRILRFSAFTQGLLQDILRARAADRRLLTPTLALRPKRIGEVHNNQVGGVQGELPLALVGDESRPAKRRPWLDWHHGLTKGPRLRGDSPKPRHLAHIT